MVQVAMHNQACATFMPTSIYSFSQVVYHLYLLIFGDYEVKVRYSKSRSSVREAS